MHAYQSFHIGVHASVHIYMSKTAHFLSAHCIWEWRRWHAVKVEVNVPNIVCGALITAVSHKQQFEHGILIVLLRQLILAQILFIWRIIISTQHRHVQMRCLYATTCKRKSFIVCGTFVPLVWYAPILGHISLENNTKISIIPKKSCSMKWRCYSPLVNGRISEIKSPLRLAWTKFEHYHLHRNEKLIEISMWIFMMLSIIVMVPVGTHAWLTAAIICSASLVSCMIQEWCTSSYTFRERKQ